MTNFVRIRKFAELTGYSEKAVERKIDSGKWPMGKIWIKAPDGRRLINLEEYEKWVQGEMS
ncbi:hypothetical protein GCM10023116_19400 [Kistimonas scapharcae]|jgi:outer membrane lipoprotein-sorting protein|uniref:Excisionase n=1 Tax=Kistimonas scapharcae TaxID=1036133 RepID=A0ABP8V196_9GAMM